MDKLPKGWETKKLKEVCIIRPPKSEVKGLKNIKVSFVPMATVNEHQIGFDASETKTLEEVYSGYTYFKDNDILLAKVTPCFENGKSAIARNLVNGIGFGSSEFYVLRPHNSVLPEWVYRIVSSQNFINEGKQNMSGAVGLKRVTLDFIGSYNIPLPPLPEQTRIASKLDALFARIDKSIALLEENIKHTKGLMASVLEEVFGGGTVSLSELSLVNPKKSEIRGMAENTQVSFLPMADLKEYQIDFQVKQVKKLNEVYTGYTYFRDNDVLVAKVTPCFENGKAGIARNLQNSIGFGSSEYHVIRARNKVLPEWIYYSIMTTSFRDEGVNNMTGSSGLKRVPPKFIEEWKIKAPVIEEQKKTIKKIHVLDKNLNEIISAQQSKLTYLKALKSSLLDRAFKGEL